MVAYSDEMSVALMAPLMADLMVVEKDMLLVEQMDPSSVVGMVAG